jgi:hypothetical protein
MVLESNGYGVREYHIQVPSLHGDGHRRGAAQLGLVDVRTKILARGVLRRCSCVCTHVYTHVSMCWSFCMSMSMCVFVCVCACVIVCMCTCVCVCVCVCVDLCLCESEVLAYLAEAPHHVHMRLLSRDVHRRGPI